MPGYNINLIILQDRISQCCVTGPKTRRKMRHILLTSSTRPLRFSNLQKRSTKHSLVQFREIWPNHYGQSQIRPCCSICVRPFSSGLSPLRIDLILKRRKKLKRRNKSSLSNLIRSKTGANVNVKKKKLWKKWHRSRKPRILTKAWRKLRIGIIPVVRSYWNLVGR